MASIEQAQLSNLSGLEGSRRVPRSKPLVLKTDSRHVSQVGANPELNPSRCSSRGPLGSYNPTGDDSEEERRSTSKRISQNATHRFSSLTLQQQMGFYSLKHVEPTSQSSSPELSPLTTPYGSVEKLKTAKDGQADYMFPMPPVTRAEKPALQDVGKDHFSGLGLDALLGLPLQQAEQAETPVPQRHGATAFAPAHYDSDSGLTGSQGWSPSTCAPSVCPSPLNDSESFKGHSRSVSFTQPLSIRKTSGMQGSIIDHAGALDHSFHNEDEVKLERLRSSLNLLGLQEEADHRAPDSDDGHSSDAASESSPQHGGTPLRLDARMFYSPEHGAPSLAEQLAYACGNGYGYEVQEGVSHHDSSMAYLPTWLQERLDMSRRDSQLSASSSGLNPLSGLQAEVEDSWTEAHGHSGNLHNADRRPTMSSTATSNRTSAALGSPILQGPLSAVESHARETGGSFDSNASSDFTAETAPSIHREANLANNSIKQIDVQQLFRNTQLGRSTLDMNENTFEAVSRAASSKPRLSLSPQMNLLQEFSYISLFNSADQEELFPPQESRSSDGPHALFSPPLSTPELERECRMSGTEFGDLVGFPSPVVARPSSIGMRPFALPVQEQSQSLPQRRGLVASKSMFDLHSQSLSADQDGDDDEALEGQTLVSPKMTVGSVAMASQTTLPTSQSVASVLNRGRPVRQCGYLQSRPDVITVTRSKPRLTPDGVPARPSRLPPPVPKRSSSMGRLSAADAIRESFLEKSKAEEFASKVESGQNGAPPTQLIPGHRNSGSRSMLAIDKGMLFSPPTPQMLSGKKMPTTASQPALSSAAGVTRPAIDLQATTRPRVLSREASAAMKQAKFESDNGRKMSKSSSTTSGKPLFAASIFKRSNASTASLPKASKSMVNLHREVAEVGPKNESMAPIDVSEAPVKAKSANNRSSSKGEQKPSSKTFLGRSRTKSQSAASAAIAKTSISAPCRPSRCQSEPAGIPKVSASSKHRPQMWAVERAGSNDVKYLRSPAQDSMIFPASHSMPTVFVARTQSQRRRGETGIMETTPSPLLPSHFRREARGVSRPTRWSSAKALIDERGMKIEKSEHETSALPTPNGCVLVVEDRNVREETLM
ncbi:unnamed protein product [Sympodiomycopsis kandeliae]